MSRKEPDLDNASAISFKVDVSRLPESGITVRLDASEEELKALATVHGVEAVRNFHAEFKLARWKAVGIRARGYVDSDIVQQCVVTLEPVDARIREEVDLIFVPEGAAAREPGERDGKELLIDYADDEEPETFRGNKIDLGAIAEEFFELGIDPYPRKPGAGTTKLSDDADEGNREISPFAALEKLKSGKKQQKN